MRTILGPRSGVTMSLTLLVYALWRRRPTMDNATALQKFEQQLRRRSPDRSTPIHYVSDVRQFQHLCPKPWSEVTRTDIEAFVDRGLVLGWKPATLQRRVAALKVFFDFCADESEQEDRLNPVQPSRHAPRRGERLPRDLPDDLVERLWMLIDHPRDQVWFTLMLRAGLRVGEVVALTRSDILAPATPTSPARLRVLGKGRKERTVYLTVTASARGLRTPCAPTPHAASATGDVRDLGNQPAHLGARGLPGLCDAPAEGLEAQSAQAQRCSLTPSAGKLLALAGTTAPA